MLTVKVVIATCFLALVFDRISTILAHPSPGPPNKKLIIYTPVRFKVIHHHKVEEVPIIIKKHLHYHLNERESKIKHYNHYHYTFEDDHHHHDYHHDHHHHHHHEHEQQHEQQHHHQQETDLEEDDHDESDENDEHHFTVSLSHNSEEDSTPLKAFYAYKSHPTLKGFDSGFKTGGSSTKDYEFVQHGHDSGSHNSGSHHFTLNGETNFGDHNYKVHDDYDEYESTNEDANENESFNYDYE